MEKQRLRPEASILGLFNTAVVKHLTEKIQRYLEDKLEQSSPKTSGIQPRVVNPLNRA
jgi:hypothetical protein